eukprot:8373195-Lingulodinium_polyedra.AAC.1
MQAARMRIRTKGKPEEQELENRTPTNVRTARPNNDASLPTVRQRRIRGVTVRLNMTAMLHKIKKTRRADLVYPAVPPTTKGPRNF